MTNFRIVLLIGATLGNLWLARKMLGNPHCHGFHRFFIFQSIILLLVLKPGKVFFIGSVADMVSILLLFFSIVYAISGYYLLWTRGRPQAEGRDETFFEFENTTNLVRTGIYRLIRHPMYGSLLFLALGTYVREITLATTGLIAVCLVFTLLAARVEEEENLQRFGTAYRDYCQTTKRFIPYLW